MTNEAIIAQNASDLVAAGLLGVVNVGGVQMPEPIHTFAGWKELGYSVKKGERARIRFPIWKHTAKTVIEDGKEKQQSSMFLKTAAFFTFAQVEKIKKEGSSECEQN